MQSLVLGETCYPDSLIIQQNADQIIERGELLEKLRISIITILNLLEKNTVLRIQNDQSYLGENPLQEQRNERIENYKSKINELILKLGTLNDYDLLFIITKNYVDHSKNLGIKYFLEFVFTKDGWHILLKFQTSANFLGENTDRVLGNIILSSTKEIFVTI